MSKLLSWVVVREKHGAHTDSPGPTLAREWLHWAARSSRSLQDRVLKPADGLQPVVVSPIAFIFVAWRRRSSSLSWSQGSSPQCPVCAGIATGPYAFFSGA